MNSKKLEIVLFTDSKTLVRGIWQILDAIEMEVAFSHVQTTSALQLSLKTSDPDFVVVSFGFLQSALHQEYLRQPILVLCANTNEEKELLQFDDLRIVDVLSQDHLFRLPYIIRREHQLKRKSLHQNDVLGLDQFKTLELIKRSESRLRTIIDGFLDPILITDRFGIVRYANDAFTKLMGYHMVDILVQPIHMLLEEHNKTILDEHLEVIITNSNHRVTLQHEVLKSNGDSLWVGNSMNHLTDPSGHPMIIFHLRDISDQIKLNKQKEEVIAYEQNSRALIKRILEGISDVFISIDTQGHVVFVNHRAATLMEMDREEIIGKDILSLQSSSLHSIQPRIRELLVAPQNSVDEIFNTENNRWYEARFYSREDGINIYLHDITDRKESAEIKKESDELFEKAFLNSPNAILIIDVETRAIVAVNKKFTRDSGYTQNEVVGKTSTGLGLWQNIDEAFTHLEVLQTKGYSSNFKFTSVNKAGERRHSIVSAEEFEYKGKPHYLAVVRDVHEMVMAQENLRLSEERYQMAITGANDGLWDWNITTNQVYLSPRCQEILGLHSIDSDVESMSALFHLLSPEDRDKIWPETLKHFQTRVPFNREIKIVLPSSKESHWILVRGQAIWNEEGRAVRMAGSVTDIHNRKMLEEELLQKNQQLESAQSELLHVQSELQNANERFDLAINAAEEGIWEWNILTGEEYLSPKWYQICGITQDETVANFDLWESRIHPDHLPMVKKAIQDHLENRAPYNVEYLHLHTDGGYRWQKSTGQAIRNAKGENIKMVGSIRDITRKKAELEAVTQRDQIQNAILTAMPDLLFRTSPDGRILDYHASAQTTLYMKPEDFINKLVNEVLPLPVSSMISDAIAKVHREGGMELLEYTLPINDQQQFFEARIVPISDREVLSVIRDLTLEKTAELNLFKEQIFSDQVLELMQHGFSMLDADGVHLRVNKSLCEMTGYSIEELVGSGLPHLYWPEEEYDNIQKAFQSAMSGPASSYELTFKKKNGLRFPVSIAPVRIVDEDNKMVRAFAIIKDISERKEHEQRATYKAAMLESVAMIGSLLLSVDDWDNTLVKAFAIIGNTMKVDAIFYFSIKENAALQRRFVDHEVTWMPAPQSSLIRHPDFQNIPWEFYGDFIDHIAENHQYEEHVTNIPEGPFKDHLVELSVKSVLILPIFKDHKFIGFIGFDECKNERRWTHAELSILRIIINNMVTALTREEDEKRIQMNNERYEYVLRATFDVIWDYDIERELLYWGNNYELQLGHDPSDHKANLLNWEQNITPEDRDRVSKSFHDAIAGNGYSWEEKYRFIKKDGSVCFIRDRGYILRHPDGQAYRMIGAMSDISDVVMAQHNLQQSESELKKAQELARLGNWSYQLINGDLKWSDEMYRIFEIDKSDNVNLFEAYISRMHPEDVKDLMSYVESGQDYEFDHRIILSNHRIKHILCLGYFTRNDEGKNIVLNGTAQDITDRRIAEEAIRKLNNELEQKVIERTAELENSRAKLLHAQNVAGMGYWEFDMATKHVEWSDSLYTVFGFELDKPLPNVQEIRSMFRRKALFAANKIVTHAVENKQSFEFDMDFTNRQNKHCHVVVSGQPNFNSKNQLISLSGVLLNITDRKNIELRIEEQRNTFLTVLEQSLSGYFDWYFLKDYEYMSPTLKGLFGYTEHEMENSPSAWRKLIFEEDLPAKMDQLQLHIDSHGAHPYEVESRFRHKNGSTVWILCKGTVIEWGPKGEAIRMVGCHINITRQKEIETSLKKNRQALESFSYSVSHDLRAPLRGIDGWSHALLEDYGHQLDDTAQIYLSRVRSESQRMGKLLDEMLKLSRIGHNELVWSPVQMSDLVNKVIHQQKMLNPEIHFDLNIAEELTTWGDSNLLEIMLTNLITNAIKFSREKNNVYIEFGIVNKDHHNAYYLKDRGIGFDMGSANKLFGVFQRLHSEPKYPGSGIGLAIVQRIVHLHQGIVWAESEINEGTSFYFTINK
jgi:PAS domain S-box-containing protein